MAKLQFRVLYREFLFRVVDLELLTPQGDVVKLLGQFAALLVTISLILTLTVLMAGAGGVPEASLLFSWISEHSLISTSMLVVGLFAVLSWDTAFPDKRDVMVLTPLPVRAPTLFLAKASAVATALAVTLLALNFFPSLAAAFVFAETPVMPPPVYQPALSAVGIDEMQAVLKRDLRSAFTQPDGAFASEHHGGAVVGLLQHGKKRVITYGTAQPDSIFEIGSISKTFTGLLLARMIAEGAVTLKDPVGELLPPGTVAKPPGREITLLDLITHHSGLPRMPGNFSIQNAMNQIDVYPAASLYVYMAGHGVKQPLRAPFLYSNLGVGLLGQALADRAGTTYPKPIEREITVPLHMSDTAATRTREQAKRSFSPTTRHIDRSNRWIWELWRVQAPFVHPQAKIAEQPDILPSSRGIHWLPRFGASLETAIGQFSLRTLVRSRQHRVLLSFYLGGALGIAIFVSKAPILHADLSATDVWYHVNAPLIVGSVLMMVASVVGTRVVFSLPLELRANWVFRLLPLPGLPGCLAAIRRSLYVLGILPVWAAMAMVFFWLWPWHAALEHVVVLAMLGVLVAECSLIGFQKIPFTCSYRPGRSKFHMAALSGAAQLFLLLRGAEWERSAFDSPVLYAGVVGGLLVAAILARWHNSRQAEGLVQFEDLEPPAIQALGIHRDGAWPETVRAS